MSREVVSIHVGQAGTQMGSACWELFCKEHTVEPDGRCLGNPDNAFTTFFENTRSGQYVPRALFVDLETSVMDEVQNGKYKDLFSSKNIVTGTEDAANNYARGRYTQGKRILDTTIESLRNITEACDNLQGLMVTHSAAGGTGSGLTSLIMESVQDELKKKVLLGIDVYPSFKISTSLVEPYNSILCTNINHDLFGLNLPIDNEAVYDICCRQLDIKNPSYDNLNRVISQLMSSITVSCRFPGTLNTDLNEFQTNLIPFPYRHYVVSAFAPLTSSNKSKHDNLTSQLITTNVLHQNNRMLKCDIMKGISSGSMFLYRGKVNSQDVTEILKKVSNDKKYFPKIADFNPCPFKIGVNSKEITAVDSSAIAPADRAVALLMNNTAITELWENLLNNFNLMYKKRAFVHWYVGEGMEEAEFEEAFNNIQQLTVKYRE